MRIGPSRGRRRRLEAGGAVAGYPRPRRAARLFTTIQYRWPTPLPGGRPDEPRLDRSKNAGALGAPARTAHPHEQSADDTGARRATRPPLHGSLRAGSGALRDRAVGLGQLVRQHRPRPGGGGHRSPRRVHRLRAGERAELPRSHGRRRRGADPAHAGRLPHPLRSHPAGGFSENMHKPVLAQHAAMLTRRAGSADWIRPSLPAIGRFIDRYLESHVHARTGLAYWQTDFAIGVDNDPSAFYRPAQAPPRSTSTASSTASYSPTRRCLRRSATCPGRPST